MLFYVRSYVLVQVQIGRLGLGLGLGKVLLPRHYFPLVHTMITKRPAIGCHTVQKQWPKPAPLASSRAALTESRVFCQVSNGW